MSALAVIISVILGLIVNECTAVSPWAAQKIVRWSARLRYDDPKRAEIRGEELAALIKMRPGNLFKLITALCFVATALRVWIIRAATGVFTSVPTISTDGTAILKKVAVTTVAGTLAFTAVIVVETAVNGGPSGTAGRAQQVGAPSGTQRTNTPAGIPKVAPAGPNTQELASYTFDLPQTYSAPLGAAKPTQSQLTEWSGGDVFYDGNIITNSSDEILQLPGGLTPTYHACMTSTLIEDMADASAGTTFCVKENGKIAGVIVDSVGTARPYDYYLQLSVTVW